MQGVPIIPLLAAGLSKYYQNSSQGDDTNAFRVSDVDMFKLNTSLVQLKEMAGFFFCKLDPSGG